MTELIGNCLHAQFSTDPTGGDDTLSRLPIDFVLKGFKVFVGLLVGIVCQPSETSMLFNLLERFGVFF